MANILILDDDSRVIQQLTELVRGFGHRATASIYPDRLLDILDRQPADLILMDVYMPEVDGLDLLGQLKASARFRDIPVIMITSEADEALLARCFQAGAADFLAKPVSETELRARVQSALTARESLARLALMNRRLKSIFDGMPEAVVALDDRFRLRLISERACRLLNVAERDVLDKPAAAVLGAPVAGPSGPLAANEPVKDAPVRLLSPSGASIPVSLTIARLEPGFSDVAWLLFFRDRREAERQAREKGRGYRFGRMIGGEPVMRDLFRFIEKVAASDAPVLIQGESGTGKELAACEIHDRGRRAQKPFHAVNCAAIPEGLLESELFGHERGAFTGAHQAKPGHFELARGGVLFLDEIAELPLPLQAKLLRALQERTFTRVGGVRPMEADVRVIAATARDLRAMAADGAFREDLYYRLDVITVALPPLRERLGDIPALAAAFIDELNRRDARQIMGFDAEALRRLLAWHWPGNVRELRNAVERAFAVSDDSHLHTEHLPDHFQTPVKPAPPAMSEEEAIRHALAQANFKKGKAAALLGVSPATLYRKRKKYGL